MIRSRRKIELTSTNDEIVYIFVDNIAWIKDHHLYREMGVSGQSIHVKEELCVIAVD
jgi:hypothetical protein